MEMWELHVIFKGKVQGVGFRWTVADHAKTFHLLGSVRNISNGSVEAYLQGPKDRLEKFLDALQQDPGNAQITSISTRFSAATERFESFQIF